MAKDDWAIVVGVQAYPAFDSQGQKLQGPENDARAFRDWLVSPEGGVVPRRHVRLILSSSYDPPFPSALAAHPTALEVAAAIRRLWKRGREKGYVGRRLYLYFAGHGFAPRVDLNPRWTALLMANAEVGKVGQDYHILGTYVADAFRQSGFFDEVLLFMDCCRELNQLPPNQTINKMPSDLVFAPAARLPHLRSLYGFATKLRGLSREHVMEDGRVHGVFTTALLAGLKGAAADPTSGGSVTVDSLCNYLYNFMRKFLTDEERAIPGVTEEPEMVPDPAGAGEQFLVCSTAEVSFPATVHVPDALAGRTIEIRSGLPMRVLETRTATAPVMKLNLRRALYVLRVLPEGREAILEVSGVGGASVNL